MISDTNNNNNNPRSPEVPSDEGSSKPETQRNDGISSIEEVANNEDTSAVEVPNNDGPSSSTVPNSITISASEGPTSNAPSPLGQVRPRMFDPKKGIHDLLAASLMSPNYQVNKTQDLDLSANARGIEVQAADTLIRTMADKNPRGWIIQIARSWRGIAAADEKVEGSPYLTWWRVLGWLGSFYSQKSKQLSYLSTGKNILDADRH
jgi:hypothetical protein